MKYTTKYNKLHVFLIVALCLYLTKFIDYSGWNPTLAGQLSYFLYAAIIVIVCVKKNKIKIGNNPFSFELGVFMITPFLTYFSQLFIYGGSISVIKSYIYHGIVVIFYLFYIYRVKEEEVIKAISYVAIGIAIIQIVQQLNPDMAMFGTGDGTKDLEVRNGLLRFRFSTIYYTTIALYFYWERTVTSKNKLYAALFLLLAVSDYLYLTRQFIAGMIVALAFSLFYVKNKSVKRYTSLFIALIVSILIYHSEVLLSYFIESSIETVNDSDYIRFYAYEFYWDMAVSSIGAFLFGNGFPADLKYWQETLSLYVSDIGIVGQIFTHGIFWIIAYITALYKILWKYRKKIPLYIKLFVLSAFVHCFMVAPYGGASTLFTWVAMLYISSLHINSVNRLLLYNENKYDFN